MNILKALKILGEFGQGMSLEILPGRGNEFVLTWRDVNRMPLTWRYYTTVEEVEEALKGELQVIAHRDALIIIGLVNTEAQEKRLANTQERFYKALLIRVEASGPAPLTV